MAPPDSVERKGGLYRSALIVWLAAALGSTSAVAQQDALDLDRTVFEAIVRETVDSIPETLLVDVRSLVAGADLTGLDPEDIDVRDPEVAGARAAVAERLGIGQTDALAERACLWTRGVPRPQPPGAAETVALDSLASARHACLRRPPFAVIMAGRPEPLAAGGGVRVRVLRFSTYAYGYWDYTLRRDPAGRWTVVERRRYLNVMS